MNVLGLISQLIIIETLRLTEFNSLMSIKMKDSESLESLKSYSSRY